MFFQRQVKSNCINSRCLFIVKFDVAVQNLVCVLSRNLVTISFMELSKWHELQELIDGAMEQIQPVQDYPVKWSECIVRDKGYDKADTGFRRARVIDLSKLPRVSVELIDSSKKVSFKCSRIYPSPSIIGSLEKTSMTAAISSSAAANLQLVEGGKYRAVLGKFISLCSFLLQCRSLWSRYCDSPNSRDHYR